MYRTEIETIYNVYIPYEKRTCACTPDWHDTCKHLSFFSSFYFTLAT